MSAAKRLDFHDLIPMDIFQAMGEAVEIDLVYADAEHPENIFSVSAYMPGARLSLHKDLAAVVVETSRLLHRVHGWTLVLKDGLRTVEAQQTLIETDIVRANPHWLEEPRLLSSPGQGAHPRGMAIDVSVLDGNGVSADMGTIFDEMVPESARGYDGFGAAIQSNRRALEEAFLRAGEKMNVQILPLPSEWWDFRIRASLSGQYAPLSDADLPPPLRMTGALGPDEEWDAHHAGLAKAILQSL